MAGSNIVNVRELTKIYQQGEINVIALNRISFDIQAGEFLALMGPSGSGKSTLLHIIAGVDRPTSGACRVQDIDLTQLNESALADWRNQNVGFVFQRFNLTPVLTAFENIELPLLLTRLNGKQRCQQVNTALELVGLSDRSHHLPKQLSGGQEQRVAIARAIVTDPVLVVAVYVLVQSLAVGLKQCSANTGDSRNVMMVRKGSTAESSSQVLGNLLAVAMSIGAIFAAMNTMYASVGARTREIGTLRVLGFRRRNILLSFLNEGALLALMGGGLGCLFALPIHGYATGTISWESFAETVFQFRITPWLAVKGLAFSMAVGIAGSLLPALRASRLPVIAALRAV